MSLYKVTLPAQCEIEYSIQADSEKEALNILSLENSTPVSTKILKQDLNSIVITGLPHQYRVSIAKSIVFEEYTLFADSEESAIEQITKTELKVSGSHTEQNESRVSPIVETLE